MAGGENIQNGKTCKKKGNGIVEYVPFGREIKRELEALSEKSANGERKYTLDRLAHDAGCDPSTLNKHCTGCKKPQLEMVMRYIAVLAPSPDRADVILRSAGHDITYDHDKLCPAYRAIRDYVRRPECTGDDVLEEISELLGSDVSIYDRYR